MSEVNDTDAEYRDDGDQGEQKPPDDSAPWLEDTQEFAGPGDEDDDEPAQE